MIHIENVTINIHQMPEILFAEQTQEGQDEFETHPTILRARMTFLMYHSAAWIGVCKLLDEVSPGWNIGPGSTKENAIAAIRAMAKAR